jgi:hypothetical protein
MKAQESAPKDRKLVARELDKKKKKHLFKTFIRQGIKKPFCAPLAQIVHISPKSCNKLGVDKEKFR